MWNGRLALVCEGGAIVQARAATLASASPVLRNALSSEPTAAAGELRLEQDDPATWAAALRLLEPKEHPQAPVLSAANLEAVLVLADKYDMAAVRCICVGFMGSHMTGLGLDAPLTSPINILKAATLIERYCAQPEMLPHAQPLVAVLDKALASANESIKVRVALLALLKPHAISKEFRDLVAPGVQDKVIRTLASSLDGMRVCPSCGCLHGFTEPRYTWKCAQCGRSFP